MVVLFGEAHQDDALGGAGKDRNTGEGKLNDDALGGGEDDLLDGLVGGPGSDKFPSFGSDLHGFNARAGPFLLGKLGQCGALANALFGNCQKGVGGSGGDGFHTDDIVILGQFNAPDADGIPALRFGLLF